MDGLGDGESEGRPLVLRVWEGDLNMMPTQQTSHGTVKITTVSQKEKDKIRCGHNCA